MKLPIRHQRLMKEHVDPVDRADFAALKVAAQIAVTLLIALTVSALLDGDDAPIVVRAAADPPSLNSPAAGSLAATGNSRQ